MRRTPSHSAVRKSRFVVSQQPLILHTTSPSRARRARNKVWLASDNKDSTSSGAKTTTPARRLSGHELKTKQGNRQWVSKIVRLSRHRFPPTTSTSAVPSSAHPLKCLSGRESKTRHGNRQWVSKHVRRTPQLTPNYTRGTGYRGFHKQKERGSPGNRRRRNLFSSRLISLSGQKFVVDSGGCRMKRVSLSTTPSPFPHRPRIRSRGRSVSESRHASVKQYLARYIVVMCYWAMHGCLSLWLGFLAVVQCSVVECMCGVPSKERRRTPNNTASSITGLVGCKPICETRFHPLSHNTHSRRKVQ